MLSALTASVSSSDSRPASNVPRGSDNLAGAAGAPDPNDVSGFISVDVLKRYLKTSNYEFYICGPPPLMGASWETQVCVWRPSDSVALRAGAPQRVTTSS